MSRTFISYSREDKELVARLVEDLRAGGADLWFDLTDLKPGRPFPGQIHEALKDAECLVAVLSTNSINSRFCRAEWLTAFNAGKTVIPILITDIEDIEIPFFLVENQYVEFFDNYEPGLERLKEALPQETEAVEPAAATKTEAVPGVEPTKIEAVEPAAATKTEAVEPAAPRKSEAVPGVEPPKIRGIPGVAPPPRVVPPIPWVEIQAGPFTRGCPDPERLIAHIKQKTGYNFAVFHKYPLHQEELPRFWIGKTPVTNLQYQQFVRAEGEGHRLPEGWQSGPDPFPDSEAEHPVTGVSWQEATAFATWASARLPTRAESEKACRGTDGRLYPWGNEFDPARCNTLESRRNGTTRCDEFPTGTSPYGVLDMVGNVWEWVADDEQGVRMTVGASFTHNGEIFGAAFLEMRRSPESRESDVGFRLARS